MPAAKKESERKFEAIRDTILARTGVSLKKADEEVSREYTMTPRKKAWEEEWGATRDNVLGRIRARAELIKEEVRRTGKLDLSKSAEDFDPFLVRAERFLGQVSLQKEAMRDSRLAKYSGRARQRVTLIKQISRQIARSPAKNLVLALRKERIRLIEDLLCTFAIRKGLA